MKSETSAPLSIALTWQIPATLNAKLIAEAGKEKRVRHAQIIDALGKFFEPPDEKRQKGAIEMMMYDTLLDGIAAAFILIFPFGGAGTEGLTPDICGGGGKRRRVSERKDFLQ